MFKKKMSIAFLIPLLPIYHISEDVIKAAINFVDVCCQHTSFMAGRGVITEEISTLIAGMFSPITNQYKPLGYNTVI